MINLCEEFGQEFSVTFNEKKTECIKFGNNLKSVGNLYMAGTPLLWKSQVKHLGNILNSSLNDKDDINLKKGIYYGNINKLIATFGGLPSKTLEHLFQSYCTCFYGSQLWVLHSKYMDDIYIAWQKGLRRIWKIPYQTHRCLLPFLSSMKSHISVQFIFRFIKLYQSMYHNNNDLVSFVAHQAVHSCHGRLGINMQYIKYKYNINIYELSYGTCVNNINKQLNKNDDLVEIKANTIKQCCDIRDDEMYIANISKADIVDIINDLCLH
jgi:hypothetical protein